MLHVCPSLRLITLVWSKEYNSLCNTVLQPVPPPLPYLTRSPEHPVLTHIFRLVPLLRLLVTDVRVQSRASSCGICGGQSEVGTRLISQYCSFSLSVSSTHHGHYTIFTFNYTRAPSIHPFPQREVQSLIETETRCSLN